jgi:hypothetical protein
MAVRYPGATPEFRILEKQNGTTVFQVRYVNETQKYTSRWEEIPVIKEETLNGSSSTSST